MVEQEAVCAYGEVLRVALEAAPCHNRRLSGIAEQCAHGEFSCLADVHLALERAVSASLYWLLLAVMAILLALLYWLGH